MARDFVERRVREAVGAELAQALVMIYCRHLHHPRALKALRAMVAAEPGVIAEFDALDALHVEVPFQDLAHLTLREELDLLYWHQAHLGAQANLGQLRRLCAHDPALCAAFDRHDRLRRRGA